MPCFVALLALGGCPWLSDAQVSAIRDADGDGLAAVEFGGADCDDADAEVGGPSAFYEDKDGDGLGNGAVRSTACEAVAGLVREGTDCDDTDATIGEPVTTWPDDDGDGFAAGDAVGSTDCEPGGVVDRGDCNDADDAIFPGAPEDCLVTEDRNCDGRAPPEGCTTDSMGPFVQATRGADALQIDFGWHLLGNVDVDGDGLPEVVAGAPFAPGVYAFSGLDLEDRSQIRSLDDTVLDFEPWCLNIGESIAAGDVDGDGVADLIAGCPGYDPNNPESGQAELAYLSLPASGLVQRMDGEILAAEPGGFLGQSLAWTASVGGDAALLAGAPWERDGDGDAWLLRMPFPTEDDVRVDQIEFTDVNGTFNLDENYGLGYAVAWVSTDSGPVAAISAPGAEVEGENPGLVVFWSPHYVNGSDKVEAGTASGILGMASYDYTGYSLASADINGDGEGDLIVGSPSAYGQQVGSGTVAVFTDVARLAGVPGTVNVDDAEIFLRGDDHNGDIEHGSELGAAVCAGGDMNGDGLADFAAGAPSSSGISAEPDAGAVYVVPGGIAEGEWDIESVAWSRYGGQGGLWMGGALAEAGDLDDDGRGDLVVGLPGWTDAGTEVAVGAFTIWWGSDL